MEKRVFIFKENITDNINLNEYTHLRAYHACRPINVKEYLTNGIKPINYDYALKEVKKRIVDEELMEQEIITQFKRNWEGLDDIHKKVWLEVNKKVLLTYSSHYLNYGSEFIGNIAMQLGCQDVLKQSGKPTIFMCDLPIEDISRDKLVDIERAINSKEMISMPISVNAVAFDNIIDYEHPLVTKPNPFC